MEVLGDLVKILLPAAVVLYAMFLTVKTFLTKDFEKKLIEIKIKNNELVLPVRLQAYERMCLFLERVSPHNLVLRVNDPAYNVYQLQHRLVSDIREEFNHNLSQQVYMSDQSWELVKGTMEDIIGIINMSAQGLAPEAKGLELGKSIFENLLKRNDDPTTKALKFIKSEIRQSF